MNDRLARKFLVAAALVAFVFVSTPTWSQSAWVPRAHESTVGFTYLFQTYDEFYRGSGNAAYPFGQSNQHNLAVSFEYGLSDDVAIDVSLGYAHASTPRTPTSNLGVTDDGMGDSSVGIRWKLLDEFDTERGAPTLTLRVGGIVAGSYEAGLPYSAGDGASGVESSLLLGKSFGYSGFGIYGEVGYRHRSDKVPADLFSSIGVYKSFTERWTASVGYRRTQGLSGSDIGDPDFRFQELREIADYIETGLGFTDAGGRYYGVFVAYTLSGRNTPRKTVFGTSVSLPF